MKVSTNAGAILKDQDIFGDGEHPEKPGDMVAKPFNPHVDAAPNGMDRDGVEWVGEGIEIDNTVAKNGVFH